MPRTAHLVVALSVLGCFASAIVAQESRWGAPDDDTVKFMTAAESKWADSACGPQSDLGAFIADDFRGTSTKGRRYGKDEAIGTDSESLSRDCRLGDVKIRFFGDSVAVAYGAESRIDKADDGTETKRCQVWTDTWLKRAGTWQIVAAQDTVVPCDP